MHLTQIRLRYGGVECASYAERESAIRAQFGRHIAERHIRQNE
jgi:hypothetical protein